MQEIINRGLKRGHFFILPRRQFYLFAPVGGCERYAGLFADT